MLITYTNLLSRREEQNAFCHSYEFVRGQKLGVIRLNPVVADRIAKDGLRETLHPRHLPMLIKPKPWLGPEEGGYLYNKCMPSFSSMKLLLMRPPASVMRFKDSAEQQTYLEHATGLGNVELVYAGLDVLGSTPWKINRDVFDVVLKVWNSGERLCKIPPAVYDKPEPEKPENLDTDVKTRSVYGQRLRSYQQDKASNHSERCNVNYKIEIARAVGRTSVPVACTDSLQFLGDMFYLPHNLDFRGRAYPIPPHLNHIGDDLSRGLLMFAEAKPLGERGLRWLKIHLANLYGFDKGSFDERVGFVMNHLDDIYDSAERPLEVCVIVHRMRARRTHLFHRVAVGGRLPVIHGSVSLIAWNFVPLWNLAIRRNICPPFLYTRTGHAMAYSTILPWEAIAKALRK